MGLCLRTARVSFVSTEDQDYCQDNSAYCQQDQSDFGMEKEPSYRSHQNVQRYAYQECCEQDSKAEDA